ncbi:MaoC/PaaZ C-terminal domain-containing protein [Arthrobacter sp. LAPM80]|uniref:MaoC/PaaZ C-terminal domain-containing protein n=1 Tax=Arthrobacter sp. LAPM80 TaxID=3141788 RepID=UPI00398B6E85
MTPKPPRLTAEHLRAGETVGLGHHRVSKEEIIRFASEWDSQYFHTDPTAALESYFGGLIASGLHTLSIFQRLSVLDFFEHYDVIAGKEIRRLRFLYPVRAGNVLTGSVHIDSVNHDGQGRASVVTSGSLWNQDNVPVLELQMEALIASESTIQKKNGPTRPAFKSG